MKIAVSAGYWGAGPPPGAAGLFDAAERLGLDQIWTAEAYGSDAWTPLAWWGSRTSRVHLGTAVSQLSARPPVTLAMTAMTMDHLTQGRVLLGIGTSNPQVVEGWYGQPYPRPLERTREYIDIVRQVIARQEPVSYDGKHYQIPLRADAGLGKPAPGTPATRLTWWAARWPSSSMMMPNERPTSFGRLWLFISAGWGRAASIFTTRSSPGWATRRRPGRSRTSTWLETRRAPSRPSPPSWWKTWP